MRRIVVLSGPVASGKSAVGDGLRDHYGFHKVKTRDLIVATHGRSLYILDQSTALAEWSPKVATEPAHLFSIRPSNIWQYWEDYSYRGQDFFAGENPPDGAIIDFSLAATASDG